MTDKLTLQDCFKYPNAKINYYSSQTGMTIFANVRILIEYAYKSGLSVLNVLDSFKLKLILRDITQLTDEELQYILTIYEDEPNKFIEIENKLDRIYLLDVKKHDYLRSKNILVEPEDWFKQGKAVKE